MEQFEIVVSFKKKNTKKKRSGKSQRGLEFNLNRINYSRLEIPWPGEACLEVLCQVV